ncbi:MAG: hypothetical protein ACI4OZ_02240 [Akkermansia sp.]
MAKLKTGSQAKLPTLGGSVSAGALTRAGAAGKTARPARGAAAKSSAGAAAPMWMRKAAMVGKAMNGGAKMSRNSGKRPADAPEEELPAETEEFVDEIPAPPPLPTEPVEPAKTEPIPAPPPLPTEPVEPAKTEPIPAPPPLPTEPVEPAKTEPIAAAPADPIPAPPPLPTEPVEPTKTEPIAAAPADPIPAPPPLPSEPVEPTKTEPIAAAPAAEPAKAASPEQAAAKAATSPLRKPKAGEASPLLQPVAVAHEESSGLSVFTLVVIVLLGFYLGLLMHHWQKVGEFSFFPGMPHLPG